MRLLDALKAVVNRAQMKKGREKKTKKTPDVNLARSRK